ncbi:MAG: enoyl-CoA hydratase 2, peroxisomal-like [Sphingomonas bacterium]|uniref:MaoC/PaaZ C-terminal domain-containing protein n=1 Tax=Sphingomonas bacterium TaxID=1895847 RepID=UPI0026346035|nr:MaoC/PaaZ C-terminal domain-containing protein [Sphingomonas bacterium]MDB5703838.1 enoyl-CoA hydratase 2, peroxisomal-like [Sphingomonas bacterium]
MAFDPQALLALDIAETEQTYDWRDCALYALGVGVGMDPMDERQLAFVDESRLAVLPTMATILGYSGFWVEQLPTGIDMLHVLHGEQGLRVEAPLPVCGTIRRKTRVTGIVDKGADKGALVQVAETIADDATGALLATLTSTIMCRGDGGKGGTGAASIAPHAIPDRAPDGTIAIPGSPQQALIYRLSGDLNPLHADPTIARAAGFPGPVLHGLATYGMACQVLLRALCDGDVARFRALDVRFTRPVFPGEALDLAYWIERPGLAAFQVRARDRDILAIDNGRFAFS